MHLGCKLIITKQLVKNYSTHILCCPLSRLADDQLMHLGRQPLITKLARDLVNLVATHPPPCTDPRLRAEYDAQHGLNTALTALYYAVTDAAPATLLADAFTDGRLLWALLVVAAPCR